jgi:hypothetical protein
MENFNLIKLLLDLFTLETDDNFGTMRLVKQLVKYGSNPQLKLDGKENVVSSQIKTDLTFIRQGSRFFISFFLI